MILDLRTIFITGALTCFILGAMQMLAFATGRFSRWPAWWGLSTIAIGAGLLAAALRGRIPDVLSIELANTLMIAGSMLLLFGVRSFAGRKLSWVGFASVLIATWTLLAIFESPSGFAARVAIMAVLFGLCDALTVREGLRLARQDGLRSGWVLAAVFAPTVLAYAWRGASALRDAIGDTLFPIASGPESWIAAAGMAFMILRGNALLLLAAERSNNALAAMANSDALTGTMNRAGLAASIAAMAKRAAAPRASILLVDIDHFKTLNDTMGHAAGDEVLRLFAQVARRQLRATDVVARHGGDEFVILLPALGEDEARGVAERLRLAFGEAVAARHDWLVWPTLSIGIAESALAGRSTDDLLNEADQALYCAKRAGRDRVHGAADGNAQPESARAQREQDA